MKPAFGGRLGYAQREVIYIHLHTCGRLVPSLHIELYTRVGGKLTYIKGCSIKIQGWSPAEAFSIITQAFRDAGGVPPKREVNDAIVKGADVPAGSSVQDGKG